MPEGLRLSKEELRSRFGLSSRVLIRVGALLARRVLLTEAVLDSARPGSALERLLLDPRLLADGTAVDDRLLAALRKHPAAGPDAPVAEELCAVAQGEQVVLALREELLADEGFNAPPPAAPEAGIERRVEPLPIAISPHSLLPEIIRQEESAGLFTPQEVGRLKLVLATAVNSDEKIEALRRLSFAPVPPRDKGLLFIKALSDGHPSVRKEAAIALRALGLKPEITEAIQSLSLDSRESRLFAVGRLGVLIRECPASDRAVILTVLLAVLRSESDVEIQSRIVASLADFSDLLATDREYLRVVASLLVERLVTRYAEMHRPVRTLVEALAKASPAAMGEILWAEFDRTTERTLRAFLLQCLVHAATDAKARARLAREIATLVRDLPENDAESRRLASELRVLGADAVDPLLQAIPEASEGARALLLRCLDSIASDPGLPTLLVNRIGRAVILFLASARKALRLVILEFRFLARPELQAEVRAALGAELIGHVHEHGLDVVRDATELALRRLGIPVVEPILKAAKETIHPEEQELAAGILAQVILTAHPEDKEEVALLHRVLDFLHGCWKKEDMPRGKMAIAVARVCTHPSVPAEQISAVATEFLGQVGHSPHSIDLLDALGWIASARSCPIDLRMQLGMRILGYLDSDLPEQLAREYPTPEGLHLVIQSETDIYTSLLPVVVAGLDRILLSSGLGETFRERLLGRMLEKWNEVIRFQVVWGPANVIGLAEAMGAFGRAPGTPLHLRIRVVEALRHKILNLPIVRLIGGILAVGEDSREMLRHCEEVALLLIDMSRHSDFSERDDQAVLMTSLAQIAARRTMANDRKKIEPLRRRIVDAIMTAYDNRTPRTEQHLADLIRSDVVPKALKKRIERRLGRP